MKLIDLHKELTIDERNKIIAEFMGGKYKEIYIGGEPVTELFLPGSHITEGNPELFYHESWSRLMPVVEKIEQIRKVDNGGYGDYYVTIEQERCRIHRLNEQSVAFGAGEKKIDAVYEAVTQFIIWYNSQNK